MKGQIQIKKCIDMGRFLYNIYHINKDSSFFHREQEAREVKWVFLVLLGHG